MAKIIGWRPTFGVSATSPRLGNPGSATDTCYRFKDWMKLLKIGKKLHALVSLGRDWHELLFLLMALISAVDLHLLE